MEFKKVQLNFDLDDSKTSPENYENFVYWPASHIPVDPKFSFHILNQKDILIAQDSIPFESKNDSSSDEFNYFVATLDPKKHGPLTCKPAKIFRMLPNYCFKDEIGAESNSNEQRLSQREQLNELKGKFGSKKTQRNLANIRKYEIKFGDEDVEALPTIDNSQFSNVNNEIMDIKIEDDSSQQLSTILPERNEKAKNVEEVYSFKDVITEPERLAIVEYERKLFDSIEEVYIKQICTKSNDQEHRVMAVYADALLQLIKLKRWNMRKADPLPNICSDSLKKHLFERFTSTKQVSARQLEYILTEQNKDRILVYIFILFLMLNNYRPLDIEKLQTVCKVKLNHARRILELIGCYSEIMKNSNGTISKVANLRLPLNTYKEPNKLKRMKR